MGIWSTERQRVGVQSTKERLSVVEALLNYISQQGLMLLWKPSAHFLSSGLAGLLVYWWILTTQYRYYFGNTGIQQSMRDVYGIHQYSFLLALLFAIWLHIAQDYTLNIF